MSRTHSDSTEPVIQLGFTANTMKSYLQPLQNLLFLGSIVSAILGRAYPINGVDGVSAATSSLSHHSSHNCKDGNKAPRYDGIMYSDCSKCQAAYAPISVVPHQSTVASRWSIRESSIDEVQHTLQWCNNNNLLMCMPFVDLLLQVTITTDMPLTS